MSVMLWKRVCAAPPRTARRWWWWWWFGAALLAAAITPATTGPAVDSGGRRHDVFDYLEGVGTTLDLNDRHGTTLRRLLRKLAKPETTRAEDEAKEEQPQAAAATSFLTANRFTLKMPPYIHLRRHRRRSHRHAEDGVDAVPAVQQNTADLGGAKQEALYGPPEESGVGVGRQEDAVPEVTRFYERKRLDVTTWPWRGETARRPRVTGERLLVVPTVYFHAVVVVACLLTACCLAYCLVWWDGRGAVTFADYIGQCRWLLSDFVHCRDLVVRLKRYLWRFEAIEGVRHDDLLVYVTQELQEVHDIYQRQVLQRVTADRAGADDDAYLDKKMAQLRRRKRMRRWGRMLGT